MVIGMTKTTPWLRNRLMLPLAMRAIGLAGDGSPLKHKDRPRCGARNRQGRPCAVRVEPGKARCRFHGGLSTGPRTAEGKARIAEAQRRRWAMVRRRSKKERKSGPQAFKER